MAPAAAAFYGDPTARLQTIGVTGTNGKTTTAFLVQALLEADKRQTGLLGTVKSVIGGAERAVERTTPEAIDLQRTFREMLDGGDVACAIEVSSHALELHRADAIHFAVAIFTNLTQDHLDFHGTMEEYFQAKRLLFTERRPQIAVINVDDPYGARLAGEIPGAVTFAVDSDATYRASDARAPTSAARASPCTGPTAPLTCARRCPGASTSTTCSGRSPPSAPSACRSRSRPPRSRPPATSPGGLSRSMPGRSSPCWSITRTPPTRSRTSCAPLEGW